MLLKPDHDTDQIPRKSVSPQILMFDDRDTCITDVEEESLIDIAIHFDIARKNPVAALYL